MVEKRYASECGKADYKGCAAHNDLRKMLEDKSLGAVLIATRIIGISDTPINSKVGGSGPTGSGGFSSEHFGGAFFVFVDGHVDFLDDQIGFNQAGATSTDLAQLPQMGLYQRLFRRNDGQLCHGWR